MSESDSMEILIDSEHSRFLEEHARATEFEDASEMVRYIVEEVVYSIREGEKTSGAEVDRQQVEEQLRSLGYLDNE